MALKTVSIIKKSVDSTQKTSVGTSYDKTKAASLALKLNSAFPLDCHLEGLFIKMSSISSATKLTIKLTTDSDGDNSIVTGTESTIETGVTTSTEGNTVYKIDLDYVFDSSTVYCMFKTDAGSVSIDTVELTYHE